MAPKTRMDTRAKFGGLKDPIGHQRQMSVRDYGRGGCIISLECSCGSVFATGRFAVDDLLHRQSIYGQGRDRALAHVTVELCGGQS